PPPLEPLSERAGLALGHLVEATQVRFPAVSDLARGVVFRWFTQPLLRRNRATAYAAVNDELRYLHRPPGAPDRPAPNPTLVATLYVTGGDQSDADAMAVRLGRLLAAQPLPAGVRRITTTVVGTVGAAMHHHFTFRPDGDGTGFAEDRLIRGLHPQIAARLQ